jgi:hypothetical protein
MKCRSCNKLLSAANPAGTAKQHSCKEGVQQAAEPLCDDEDQEQPEKQQKSSTGGISGQKRQRQLPAITAQQQRSINREMMLFVATSELPFLRLNNMHLRRALAIAGVYIPDEKVNSKLESRCLSVRPWTSYFVPVP